MQGPRTSAVEDVPDLEPNPKTLLVKVSYTGLCMSEWPLWAEAERGARFGHEPVGTVAAVGAGVQSFSVGDRVSGLAATPSFAEYCLMDEQEAVLVPDNLSDVDSTAEPLGCLISAASKLNLSKPGDPVAVVGTGYMGLGMVSLLRRLGAGTVAAVDTRPEARENARRLGADAAYSPGEVPERYLVNGWDSTAFARGLPIVSEWAGSEEALRLAGHMVGIHGTLGVGAWHQGGLRAVDFRLWGWKGIGVVNTHERRRSFLVECCRRALQMLSSGTWDYKGVARHVYGLDELDRAHAEMADKPEGFIKGVVRCSD